MSIRTNQNLDAYQFTVRPLSKEEGGGYLVEYPDIPGCMSDGETIEEAIANGKEALRDCVAVFQESGRKVPKPGIEAAQWRQRLPRTLYSKLKEALTVFQLDDLENNRFQVQRLGHGEQNGMILRLRSAFQDAQCAAAIERGISHYFEQQGFADVMRTGAGHENSAWTQQTQGAQVDLFIAAYGCFNLLT